jgi:hypothetical protein
MYTESGAAKPIDRNTDRNEGSDDDRIRTNGLKRQALERGAQFKDVKGKTAPELERMLRTIARNVRTHWVPSDALSLETNVGMRFEGAMEVTHDTCNFECECGIDAIADFTEATRIDPPDSPGKTKTAAPDGKGKEVKKKTWKRMKNALKMSSKSAKSKPPPSSSTSASRTKALTTSSTPPPRTSALTTVSKGSPSILGAISKKVQKSKVSKYIKRSKGARHLLNILAFKSDRGCDSFGHRYWKEWLLCHHPEVLFGNYLSLEYGQENLAVFQAHTVKMMKYTPEGAVDVVSSIPNPTEEEAKKENEVRDIARKLASHGKKKLGLTDEVPENKKVVSAETVNKLKVDFEEWQPTPVQNSHENPKNKAQIRRYIENVRLMSVTVRQANSVPGDKVCGHRQYVKVRLEDPYQGPTSGDSKSKRMTKVKWSQSVESCCLFEPDEFEIVHLKTPPEVNMKVKVEDTNLQRGDHGFRRHFHYATVTKVHPPSSTSFVQARDPEDMDGALDPENNGDDGGGGGGGGDEWQQVTSCLVDIIFDQERMTKISSSQSENPGFGAKDVDREKKDKTTYPLGELLCLPMSNRPVADQRLHISVFNKSTVEFDICVGTAVIDLSNMKEFRPQSMWVRLATSTQAMALRPVLTMHKPHKPKPPPRFWTGPLVLVTLQYNRPPNKLMLRLIKGIDLRYKENEKTTESDPGLGEATQDSDRMSSTASSNMSVSVNGEGGRDLVASPVNRKVKKVKCSPYANLRLLSHQSEVLRKRKTNVVKRNADPEWNAFYTFKNFTDIDAKIEIEIVNAYKSRNNFVGKVIVPLKELHQSNKLVKKYKLKNKEGKEDGKPRGKIELELQWLFSYDLAPVEPVHVGWCNVAVLKGSSLLAVDVNLSTADTSDPLVRIKLNKQVGETRVEKKNLNPRWNQAFSFRLTDVNADVKFEVTDWNSIKTETPIGRAIVPLNSLPTNGKVWVGEIELLPGTDEAFECNVMSKPKKSLGAITVAIHIDLNGRGLVWATIASPHRPMLPLPATSNEADSEGFKYDNVSLGKLDPFVKRVKRLTNPTPVKFVGRLAEGDDIPGALFVLGFVYLLIFKTELWHFPYYVFLGVVGCGLYSFVVLNEAEREAIQAEVFKPSKKQKKEKEEKTKNKKKEVKTGGEEGRSGVLAAVTISKKLSEACDKMEEVLCTPERILNLITFKDEVASHIFFAILALACSLGSLALYQFQGYYDYLVWMSCRGHVIFSVMLCVYEVKPSCHPIRPVVTLKNC